MDYSNNGFESSGILNASSNSISIDLSPGNTVSRDHNSADNYGYVCINIIPLNINISSIIEIN